MQPPWRYSPPSATARARGAGKWFASRCRTWRSPPLPRSVTSARPRLNKVDRPRFGNEVFGTFARDFATKDGCHVMICVFTGRQIDALAAAGNLGAQFRAIEQSHGVDLQDEAHRWKVRANLAAVIAPWIASLTRAEAAAILSKAGALWGPYMTPRELIGDPILTGNPMFARVDQPGIGTFWSAASPFDFKDATRLAPKPAPRLGQHTDEILADILGLSSGEIGRLHDDKVVAGPRGA